MSRRSSSPEFLKLVLYPSGEKGLCMEQDESQACLTESRARDACGNFRVTNPFDSPPSPFIADDVPAIPSCTTDSSHSSNPALEKYFVRLSVEEERSNAVALSSSSSGALEIGTDLDDSPDNSSGNQQRNPSAVRLSQHYAQPPSPQPADTTIQQKTQSICLNCNCQDELPLTRSMSSAGSMIFPEHAYHRAVKNSAFHDTIRCMRYRAFLRWYRGAHAKVWSRPSTALACLLAGATMLFAYHILCPTFLLETIPVLFHILVLCTICLFLGLGHNRHFVPRWSVRFSGLYIAVSSAAAVIYLGRTLNWPAQFQKARSDYITHQQEQIHAESEYTPQGNHSEINCRISAWFSKSFYILQTAVCVCGFFYSFCLQRIARRYYLKSSLFISRWNFTICQAVRLLVPALGQADKQRYSDLVKLGLCNDLLGVDFRGVRRCRRVKKKAGRLKKRPASAAIVDTDIVAPVQEANQVDTCHHRRLRMCQGMRIECEITSLGRSLLPPCILACCFCCRRNFCQSCFSRRGTKIGCWRRRQVKDDWQETVRGGEHRNKNWKVTFIGEADPTGKPHGFGFWKEDGYLFGERLVGYWTEGIPDGPYKSRELGSGSGFMCIRIGWASYTLADDMLQFGIANVECSVSGKFYRGFPAVQLVDPPSYVPGRRASSAVSTAPVDRGIAPVEVSTPSVVISTAVTSMEERTQPPGDAAASKKIMSVSDDDSRRTRGMALEDTAPAMRNIFLRREMLPKRSPPTPGRTSMFSHKTRSPQSRKQSFSSPKDTRLLLHPVTRSHSVPGREWTSQSFRDLQPVTASEERRSTRAWRRIGRGALNVQSQLRARGAAAAGAAGAAVRRRLKRKDFEVIARLEKSRRDMAWCLAELSPHSRVQREPQDLTVYESYLMEDDCLPQSPLSPDAEANNCPVAHDSQNQLFPDEMLATTSECPSDSKPIDGSWIRSTEPAKIIYQSKREGSKKTWNISPQSMKHRVRSVLTRTVPGTLNPLLEEDKSLLPHTPFYRRPTIEKELNEKNCTELQVKIVRRDLMESRHEIDTTTTNTIKYHQPQNIRTGCCLCPCHHNVPAPAESVTPWNWGSFDVEKTKEESELYGPDLTSQAVDSANPRVTLDSPELQAEGWMCMDDAGSPEVLLYIHGYNNSLEEILGQMAAFGNYPNHIRIFLFSWPAGKGFLDFFKARRAAEDPKTHQALADVLRTLRDNGIRQVHFMCHSMGSRLFLKSFRKYAEKLFQQVDTDEQTSSPSMKLLGMLQMVSITFLNPEYFLDEFVENDYKHLRRYCNHITIFADAKDQALWWSETLSRQLALGKTVFGLWRMKEEPFVPVAKHPPQFLNTISFFRYSSYSSRKGLSSIDGRNLNEDAIEWLDVDVIDTTFMDQNVHSMRHSYWNLNREIIEDIRECLVTRKRARQRTGRLDRRDGNVWVYRVAPSFLTSIFDVYMG